jgi:hypothetical protein
MAIDPEVYDHGAKVATSTTRSPVLLNWTSELDFSLRFVDWVLSMDNAQQPICRATASNGN